MDSARLQAEKDVLRSRLSSNIYHFDSPYSPNWLYFAARTNRGNIYTLNIDLSNFPNNIPKVFVSKMLYTKTGERMDGPSASMHTLTSENNCTRICHYGSQSWTPRVSLYKVYVKCRLWLEMYEQHLETGKPIDYYLGHQR